MQCHQCRANVRSENRTAKSNVCARTPLVQTNARKPGHPNKNKSINLAAATLVRIYVHICYYPGDRFANKSQVGGVESFTRLYGIYEHKRALRFREFIIVRRRRAFTRARAANNKAVIVTAVYYIHSHTYTRARAYTVYRVVRVAFTYDTL